LNTDLANWDKSLLSHYILLGRDEGRHYRIVVSGTAKVTNGDKTFLVTENESTHIPVGVVHALENPGKLPLEMIEVQSGSYLGGDDTVRFEDRYGRINT
jgi:mannose-6-phosphate isomerase-like protein (cupin superfamily)